jgi:hypothetical protein
MQSLGCAGGGRGGPRRKRILGRVRDGVRIVGDSRPNECSKHGACIVNEACFCGPQ